VKELRVVKEQQDPDREFKRYLQHKDFKEALLSTINEYMQEESLQTLSEDERLTFMRKEKFSEVNQYLNDLQNHMNV